MHFSVRIATGAVPSSTATAVLHILPLQVWQTSLRLCMNSFFGTLCTQLSTRHDVSGLVTCALRYSHIVQSYIDVAILSRVCKPKALERSTPQVLKLIGTLGAWTVWKWYIRTLILRYPLQVLNVYKLP
eukprot:6492623-Amphidinium_carterae.1